jgi:hypothetical protein
MQDETGREIYSQVRAYMEKTEVGMLGISTPQKMAEEFLLNLRTDASHLGKRLLIIDDRALAEMIHGVMVKRGMKLAEV